VNLNSGIPFRHPLSIVGAPPPTFKLQALCKMVSHDLWNPRSSRTFHQSDWSIIAFYELVGWALVQIAFFRWLRSRRLDVRPVTMRIWATRVHSAYIRGDVRCDIPCSPPRSTSAGPQEVDRTTAHYSGQTSRDGRSPRTNRSRYARLRKGCWFPRVTQYQRWVDLKLNLSW
jgi:hypothetical protein